MPKYFRVTTCYSSVLSWNACGGEVVSILKVMPGDYYPAVLACTLGTDTDICFLAAGGKDPVTITLQPHLNSNLLLPLRVQWLPGSSHAAFQDPLTRRYLSADPPPEPMTPGTVTAERSRLDKEGTFQLERVDTSQVAGRVRKGMAMIERILKATPLTELAGRLMDLVSKSEADIVLNAIWPLLGLADLEKLGRTLLADRAMRDRLISLLPNDPWSASTLPALAEWLTLRDAETYPTHRFELPRAQDFLTDAGLDGQLCSFGHVCNVYARSSVEGRRDICLVATARNEGIYLLEWIAYHRCIGISRILLYSNDNDDGSDELLSRLADAGVIIWIDNKVAPGGSAQNKAYGHAFGALPDVLDYCWALTIDLDEFFVFESSQFLSIRDFLRWHEMRDVDVIACNWVYIGSGSDNTWRNVPVITRNDRILGPQHVGPGYRLVKAISRPNRVIHSTPHAPITDVRRKLTYRYANGDLDWYKNQPIEYGNLPRFADVPNFDYACVYHYLYKSAEEFLWKLCRNRGDHPLAKGLSATAMDSDLINAFMEQREAIDIDRDHRIARCARDFDAELARITALPGVAEANVRVQRNFHELMRNLKRLFRSAPELRPTIERNRKFLELAGVTDL